MKMSFRWFGDSDPVSLQYIRQIPGMHGIVSAIYDVPVGEAWPLDRILALKEKVEAHGLALVLISKELDDQVAELAGVIVSGIGGGIGRRIERFSEVISDHRLSQGGAAPPPAARAS